MIFKTFEADSFEKGLKLVKKEMGPDAIIVSTRTKKPNILKGSFSKKIEIVAAYDDGIYSSPTSSPLLNKSDLSSAKTTGKEYGYFNKERRKHSYSFVNHFSKRNSSEEDENFLTPLFDSYFKNIGDFEKFFKTVGIYEDIIGILISEISPYTSRNYNLSTELKQKAVLNKLSSLINVSSPLTIPENGQRIIALTGPTGVGKTTTIAKIAAEMHFLKGKKVGLVSIDSYRIAATKQLKTYADIMDLELKTAETKRELQKAIKSFSDKELVLIDTAGHSHKNTERIKEINEMLKNILNIETWLLIAASTKTEDALNIVNEHLAIGLSGMIYTKLDETSSYETLFNTSLVSGLPVFYFTTGQEVPQDIEEASAKKIVNSLFNKFINNNFNYKTLEN
ncbi:MAG: flagellar biosynthesis protein FlhF [Candidatus Schekmanbacteria bacterium]|nr:MAG: flagellar biosynthesis protein FlhF [Candidatus Schekmanbacteria bacterium]